jgi:hypothetical protein
VFITDRGLVKPYRYFAHWQLCLAEEDWRRVTTRYGLRRSRRSRTRLPWGSRKSTTTTYDSDGALLGKRAAKDWEYAVVLHPHLQGACR